KTYRLSKDSYKVLEAKAKSWKRKAYDLDQANWGLLSAAYGKAPLHAVRIMALLTALWSLSGNPYESNDGVITSKKLERDAIKFLEFFLKHSHYCFQLIASSEDPEKAARKIRYLDQHIITGLRRLRPSGETRGTSEWATLLEGVGADKVGSRQLGKALVRIAELNLPDLTVSRPETRSSSKKQWTIRMLRQTETAQTA
ncbi:MAG: hypothetical protein P1V97_37545, partial [Planctomycetota bacterium]|nr:hypothetical protein [Planctomycetota bacterium]